MDYKTATIISVSTEEIRTIRKIMNMLEDIYKTNAERFCYDFLESISEEEPEFYTEEDNYIFFQYPDTSTEDLKEWVNDYFDLE